MNPSWNSDPRLKSMDPGKLELLIQFSEDLKKQPGNQMISTLFTLNQQAAQKGLSFSDAETALILSILTEEMTPAEQKRLRLLKNVAKKLAARQP